MKQEHGDGDIAHEIFNGPAEDQTRFYRRERLIDRPDSSGGFL
jgi:hypothetical protein